MARLLSATSDLLLVRSSLRATSLTVAGREATTVRRKPIRSARRKRSALTAWSATVLTPRQQRPSVDKYKHPSPSHGETPSQAPRSGVRTSRPDRLQARSGNARAVASGTGRRDRWLTVPTILESTNKLGVSMAFEVGKCVVAESESIDRRPRSGVVEELLRGEPSPRYRIRSYDRHESIYTPANGALRAEQRTKEERQAAPPNASEPETRRSNPPGKRPDATRAADSPIANGEADSNGLVLRGVADAGRSKDHRGRG